MTALYAGSIMAVDGLWISHEEAAQIRLELEARGTKLAKRLASEISIPSKRVHSCDNETIYQHQRKIMQHAFDVLQMSSTDPKRYIERAIDILKTGLVE